MIHTPPIFDTEGLFIYYPNNKCGQKSVVAAMQGRCIVQKHKPKSYPSAARKDYPDATVFTIVRNPYTRFLSGWRYLADKKILDVDKETVLWLLETHGTSFNLHFLPQYHSVASGTVRHILRLEDIDNEWEKIREKIKAGKLPHVNKTLVKDTSLNVMDRERIYNLYKRDFEEFGYDK